MSEREQALNMIRAMPDDKITVVAAFLRTLCEPSGKAAEIPDAERITAFEEIPNAETIAAMEETDEMIRTGGGQHFTGSTADFFAMLDAG